MYGDSGAVQDTLSALGLPAQLATSFEETECEIWPQNWKTVQLFILMATQWRIGMSGATGLDYAALPMLATVHDIRLTQKRMNGLRVMESEALRVMNEKRE